MPPLPQDPEAKATNELIIVRSAFPKYQEHYTLTFQEHNTGGSLLNINPPALADGADSKGAKCLHGRFYVGNYFTERGEFHEVCTAVRDVYCVLWR